MSKQKQTLIDIFKEHRPKILIIGHGRHGKDTVAEMLHEKFGMSYASSSMKAAEIFIYDKLKDKYGYKSFMECYEDRNTSQEKRDLWYKLISDYNKKDPARLAKQIIKDSDCYVGMRSNREAQKCIDVGLFDLIIWVDASERLPFEGNSSFKIDKSIADVIIDNNGDKKLLSQKVSRLGRILFRFV